MMNPLFLRPFMPVRAFSDCGSGWPDGRRPGFGQRAQAVPDRAGRCQTLPGGCAGKLVREAIQGGYPGRLSRELVPLEFLVGLHRHPVTLLIFGVTGVAGNVGKSDRVG